jgi:hypothetical protein
MITWIWEAFLAVVQWAWEWFLTFIGLVWDYFVSLLPADWAVYFQGDSMSGVQYYLGLVAWFFPIWGCIGIAGSVAAIVATIRLGRWIKSFVPTIAT